MDEPFRRSKVSSVVQGQEKYLTMQPEKY